MKNDQNIIEGLFFTYLFPETNKSIQYKDKNYDKPALLSKLDKDTKFDSYVQRFFDKINFVGITTDQQLYRQNQDVNVLISALNYPNSEIKLIFRLNGTVWFEDSLGLSKNGLAKYTLYKVDIGKYDITAEVKLNKDKKVGIGSANFDVAVFELDPFQVLIEEQSMSKNQKLTAVVNVSILEQPFSGLLKVGLFCSFCRQVVLRDEITCQKGKGIVSFNVSGHTAPFSLEFIENSHGYTNKIQLEGTMPHQRVSTPISAGLRKNWQMSLFPETGSIAAQGINITQGDSLDDAHFEINQVMGEHINLKLSSQSQFFNITIYNPITQKYAYEEYKQVEKESTYSITPQDSHLLVFLGAVIDNKLFEAFFICFTSNLTLPHVEVPEKCIAGEKIKLKTFGGQNGGESLIVIFDKRKTHKSLYKAIGEKVHAHLKYLSQLKYMLGSGISTKDERTKKKGNSYQSRYASIVGDDSRSRGFQSNYLMTVGRSPSGAIPLPSQAPQGIMGGMALEVDESPEDITIMDDFVDVIYCDHLEYQPGEVQEREISLGDQITTWEIRAYHFDKLIFSEEIKNTKATRPTFIEIRCPAIIDSSNGDSAEIEIHYRCQKDSTLTVKLDDQLFIEPMTVESGSGKIVKELRSKGILNAILKTGSNTLEYSKEVNLPFVHKLLYTGIKRVYPGETFLPNQTVYIHPNPLVLIRESVHALQGYPFGCAEQASAKLGALALAYEYHTQIHSGEEIPLGQMITQGLTRVFNSYFSDKSSLFGLWNSLQPDIKTSIQVMRNFIPLLKIREKLPLRELDQNQQAIVDSLFKKNIQSYELTVYSEDFLPDKDVNDPLEAAWGILYAPKGKKTNTKFLDIILNSSIIEHEKMYWRSQNAWVDKLQTTAVVLRALNRIREEKNIKIREFFDSGLQYISSHIINGRLFSTTDTLALISLFSEIPIGDVVIEIGNEERKISESTLINEEFIAKKSFFVHWTEERLTDVFGMFPSKALKGKINISSNNVKIAEELQLIISAPVSMFCPVVAICLPPNLAYLKGGGNVQQLYLPFKEDKTILLDLISVRKGKGHIRIILYDMYDPELTQKEEPILIEVK